MAAVDTRSSAGWWVALAAVTALTAYGFHEVLSVRFSSGEGYPVYSTMRADPLGARALYEALDRLGNVHSVRNFEQVKKLEAAPGDTLMLLNVGISSFNHQDKSLDGQVIARWAAAGGRVVITMDPKSESGHERGVFHEAASEVKEERRAAEEEKEKERSKKSANPSSDDQKKSPGKKDSQERKKSAHSDPESAMAEALKISVVAHGYTPTGKNGAKLALAQEMPLAAADMPEWFSGISLDDDPRQDWKNLPDGSPDKLKGKTKSQNTADQAADPKDEETPDEAVVVKPSPWHILAMRGQRGMIAERKLGKGSVVIGTDSFFASNEALWNHPKAKFLAWLVGDARRVIFDETHLGSSIGDEDSLMTLARRYRMHGLFIGGFLLFALYAWRNATSLVPPDRDQDLGHWREDAVAGQSTAAGLGGLLRRGVPRRKILRRCFDTWDAMSHAVPMNRRAKARAAMDTATDLKQTAATYRKLRDIIHDTAP